MADETEEFEFRARAEREASARQPPAVGQPSSDEKPWAEQSLLEKNLTVAHAGIDVLGTNVINALPAAINAPFDLASLAIRGRGAQPIPEMKLRPETQHFLQEQVGPPLERLAEFSEKFDPAIGPLIAGMKYLSENYPKSYRALSDIEEIAGTAFGIGGAMTASNAARAARLAATQAPRMPFAPPPNPTTARIAKQTIDENYAISPDYIGRTAGKQFEQWGSRLKTREDVSMHNEQMMVENARMDLIRFGLEKNELLSQDETFKNLRENAGAPRDLLRKITPHSGDALEPSWQYGEAIDNAGRRGPLAPPSTPDIDALKAKERAMKFNISERLVRAAELREEARKQLAHYDVSQNQIGLVKRHIADAIEDEIGRIADNLRDYRYATLTEGSGSQLTPRETLGLGARAKEARKNLAIIQFYEDAVGAGGYIRADEFRKMLAKRYPLTGTQLKIAEAATEFPYNFQPILAAGKGEHGMFSVFDYMAGGYGALAFHKPITSALSLSRPLMRYWLRRPETQQRMLARYAKRAWGDEEAPPGLGRGKPWTPSPQLELTPGGRGGPVAGAPEPYLEAKEPEQAAQAMDRIPAFDPEQAGWKMAQGRPPGEPPLSFRPPTGPAYKAGTEAARPAPYLPPRAGVGITSEADQLRAAQRAIQMYRRPPGERETGALTEFERRASAEIQLRQEEARMRAQAQLSGRAPLTEQQIQQRLEVLRRELLGESPPFNLSDMPEED